MTGNEAYINANQNAKMHTKEKIKFLYSYLLNLTSLKTQATIFITFYACSVMLLTSCHRRQIPEKADSKPLVTEKAMVVSAHPVASKIGVEVLQKGGNAVDAAVATGFALAVCYPTAGNIGGGGFMVIRLKNGESYTIDYREKAPVKAHRNLYINENGEVTDGLSLNTHLAAGVPGSVAGMIDAHKRFGKMSFNEVIQPAIDIAQKGFIITGQQADNFNRIKDNVQERNPYPNPFVKKAAWKAGDTLKQKDLAYTLSLIKEKGKEGFYSGETADKIIAEMQIGNGLISHKDLTDYKAIWRQPIRAKYKEYDIISMPPPSSGGIALVQLLKMVEPYPLSEWGHNTPKSIHLITEAERRVYADRARFLGDPDFFRVPVNELLSDGYIKQRMENFNQDKAMPSSEISNGHIAGYESEETTHYSIIDQWGNAVSTTTTLNRSYGSRILVKGAGFFLNNEMDDFSSKPGFPNSYGLVGGEANAIASEKRMLSSMTPTIICKNGDLFMVVGTPGGSTIITSVFQTILNVTEYGMNMQEAVDAPRFHHQWLPDKIYYEENCFNDTKINALKQLGHTVQSRSSIGRVDAIKILSNGNLEGGADSRGDDTALGY